MSPFKNRRLLALAFAHFCVDLFSGMVSILIAAQTTPLQLSEGQVGVAALSYSLGASLSQPLFGLFSDHERSPLLAMAGVLWQIGFIAISGLATSYGLFIGLVAVAALGAGAFHPPGAAGVPHVTNRAIRSSSMSIFIVGGNAGFALGPILGSRVFNAFGPKGTLVFLGFGLLVLPMLLLSIGRMRYDHSELEFNEATPGDRHSGLVAPVYAFQIVVLAFVLLGLLVTFRQAIYQIMFVFLPQYALQEGLGLNFGGDLSTIYFIGAALGTFAAGFAAQRIGRFPVIIGSLAVGSVFCWFLTHTSSVLFLFAMAAGTGFMMNASLPLTLVIAQELVPTKPGLVAGFVLGYTFVSGGIAAAVAGRIAENIGLSVMLSYTAPIMFAGAVCGIGAWLTLRQKPEPATRLGSAA